MPRSRKTRRGGQAGRGRTGAGRARPEKAERLHVGGLNVPPEKHAAFKAAVLEAAAANVAAFRPGVAALQDLFREHSPEAIISAFAVYGLQAVPTPQGPRKALKDIEQFHAEMLQALTLTVPGQEWGVAPAFAPDLNTVFETMPKLAMAVFHQRLVERDRQVDPAERAVLSLQERIRLHTQAVRNWGYYTEVLRILRELYAGLDAPMRTKIGFGPTDLVAIAEALVKDLEAQSSERNTALAKTFSGRNARQVIRLYYKHFGMEGDPDDLMRILPPDAGKEAAMAAVFAHTDFFLSEMATHTAAEVAALAGLEVEVANAALRAIAIDPGALVETPVEHLFLSNPVWTAPAVRLGDGRYFLALPQIVFSHFHEIVRRLAEEAGLKTALETARSRYLERALEEAIRKALPGAHVIAGAKWSVGGVGYETDVLVVFDHILLVIEAKSHHLTGPGLRGAPARVKRHIEDLVIEPSTQSMRLVDLVNAAGAGDVGARGQVAPLGIKAEEIDTIVRLSVTLDDFSVISSAEGELREAGWLEGGHALAPAVHIADLLCIIDVLENPLLLLHYLSERFHFQKTFQLVGDELDFLGLYASTGLAISNPDGTPVRLSLSGMSGSIDHYFQAREIGMRVPKPKVKLHPSFKAILDRLEDRRPDGWTTIGLHLLNAVGFEEQRVVDRHHPAGQGRRLMW